VRLFCLLSLPKSGFCDGAMGSKKSKPAESSVGMAPNKPASTTAATSGSAATQAPKTTVKSVEKPFVAKTPQKAFKDAFTLGQELGKGNYSTVRLGVNNSSKEECAIKCIVKKKLTPEDETALRVEVAVLSEVNHPSIIKMYGFFDEPLDYYIVTELMSGGELFDRIVAKEFYSENDAQKVVQTLAICLKYMHDKDIVHRDLKPENILLKDKTDDAAIKIADFGFARHIKDGCHTACGTPGYVAPEIITGKVYGKSVDVWSLGVIIYILLCGYPPFYHKNQPQLFKLIREARFQFDSPYWDPISNEARNLIKGCLTVDVEKRLTIDGVMKHPWVSGQVSKADITPVLGELKKFNARRKLRAGIKAAIAANRLKDILERMHEPHPH